MAIRTLDDTLSLDGFWEELVFTEARLLGDEQAKEFAPTFGQLLSRVEQVRTGQLGTWREEVAAQAAVAAVDDQLDDWVRALDTALLNVVAQDTRSPRYRRYFAVAPSAIIRLGLESELARVRAWTSSLTSEPEAVLKDLGSQLGKLVAQGDRALDQRRKATATRSDHRVRVITSLIDDINGARLSLYGTLTKKAVDLHLPHDWPNRFFRRATRSPGENASPPKPAPQPSAQPAA
jgi:hypothetical protein